MFSKRGNIHRTLPQKEAYDHKVRSGSNFIFYRSKNVHDLALSQAVLESGRKIHGLDVVGAFTAQENTNSNGLLEKLGFQYVGLINYLDSENNLYEYRFK